MGSGELEQLKAALDYLNRDSRNVLKEVVSVLLPQVRPGSSTELLH